MSTEELSPKGKLLASENAKAFVTPATSNKLAPMARLLRVTLDFKQSNMRLFIGVILAILMLSCSSQRLPQSTQQTFQTPQNIKIYEGSGRTLGPCEPSIYINPNDTDEIVAGSILHSVHRSSDGGRTWTTQPLQSPLGVWGDPVIIADDNGRFYYFHLSDPTGKNWASEEILDRIVVQTSDDGGATWSSGTGIGHRPPADQDKEWASVDPKTGAIYTTWTEFDDYGKTDINCSRILFSMSTDQGVNWSEPITLSNTEGDCVDDDMTTEGAVPASDGDGNIYVAWSNRHPAHGDVGGIFLDHSSDFGKTWESTDRLVATQPGGWTQDVKGLNRSNGMPITLVDNSGGPHDGRVYIAWADLRNGETNSDIWAMHSDDQGATFTDPVRVNQDETETAQFLPWLTIDQSTGKLYMIFYDRSQHPAGSVLTDVVLASSSDGVTWSQQTISESSFDPTGCPFFGDYNNIHAVDGQVRPIWTRYEDGKLSVWTALVEDK